MIKALQLTDRQYDWFRARERPGYTMKEVINHIITLVDRHEADLEKHHKWVDQSWLGKEAPHDTLPLNEG